ncbi:MAG: hypothetical protein OXD50_06885 [Chloroflexi bacterium]|nr:hypothetical protein [Chloroflexota bacterium]
MYSYRVRVYDLFHAAHRKAVQLVLSYANCPPPPRRPRFTAVETPDDEQQAFDEGLRAVEDSFAETEQAIEDLRTVLPEEVRNAGKLGQHLMFTRHYLSEKSPDRCAHDADDILLRDLPLLIERFDAWYQAQSRLDPELLQRLEAFTQLAHVNSAVREGWASFKTRSVRSFDLSENVDGARLAVQLFGSSGVLRDSLSDKDCEAYLNLLRGLYSVSRNPVVHNDASPNPAVADAVLTLLSYVLARLADVQTGDNEGHGQSADARSFAVTRE